MDVNELSILLDAKIEPLKETIDELKAERRGSKSCRLTDEEIQIIRNMIAIKKRSVIFIVTLLTAVFLWVVKDIYSWIIQHINFK